MFLLLCGFFLFLIRSFLCPSICSGRLFVVSVQFGPDWTGAVQLICEAEPHKVISQILITAELCSLYSMRFLPWVTVAVAGPAIYEARPAPRSTGPAARERPMPPTFSSPLLLLLPPPLGLGGGWWGPTPLGSGA